MEVQILRSVNDKEKPNKKRGKEQYRVVLDKDANESLAKIVKQVNEDFDCGSVNKSDVANWFFKKLNGSIAKSEIKELQELHFDEKKMLNDLLKSSNNPENNIPLEIRKALKEHYGFSASTRAGRKNSKSLSENP